MLPPLLDESDLSALPSLAGSEAAHLTNDKATPADPATLVSALSAVPGASMLRVLRIEFSSRIEDLGVLAAFPALEVLHVYGGELKRLDGIDRFTRARYLEIDTGTKKKRSLRGLEGCPAPKVVLRWAKEDDLEALGQSRELDDLTLLSCRTLALAPLSSSGLTHLGCMQGGFTRLTDSEILPRLRSLHLSRCRKLESFEGAHGHIERVILDGCPALDLSSLQRLSALEALTMVGMKGGVRLGALGALPRLRSLSIQGSSSDVDLPDLRVAFPSLERIYLSRQNRASMDALRAQHPDLEVAGDGR